MQEVTAFLTSRYRFRFNVLTEETEVASVENNIPDTHLRYTKVDERWMNSLSLEAIETGIDCWDRDIQRFVRSRRSSEYHPFTAYFEQLPEWDGTDRVSALARRVSDDPVWVNGFHRWMLGLSAQWMLDEYTCLSVRNKNLPSQDMTYIYFQTNVLDTGTYD